MQNNLLKCLIVDDEPMALELLESYVLKTPFLELKGKCQSALEALSLINRQQIDLIFLDIQMPDLNGLEFSKTLSKDTRVIFTTAFDRYALDGYKVNAIDYLLKPFNYTEFLNAANKAKDWFELKNKPENPKISAASNSQFLFVKTDYKQKKIALNEILYFEGLKDYVKIFLKLETKPILTIKSLKSLEEELATDKFMRVHRSFIVALDHIDEVERNQIIIGDKRITVSEANREKFQEFINNSSL
ncbi:LytR/AlgR family response regulator transcription factor [Zunongwangia atlantica]|uniref:LytTR family two component transcriptional regulator n=1 Tax=Zunongwangia atlantica 22II14-10F7 TaxID=1185767 RepID=A0A1Y1SXV6_9FLAO|nr:LytTR family DNA-binding domain-containing protein [Zunongwangia atlantica]ORL43580.1 LytTR family two component transcriptional regulator [Zunongwangia atlantica 22II14-10F7]